MPIDFPQTQGEEPNLSKSTADQAVSVGETNSGETSKGTHFENSWSRSGHYTSLEGMNKFIFHLMSRERICAFAEGKIDNLDSLEIAVPSVPQNEFVSSKLTEKLEHQMRDPLVVSIGAFGQPQVQPHHLPYNNSGAITGRQANPSSLPRKKFLVFHNQMMDFHSLHKVVLEVEYNEEVGTGLGLTMEFYTLVSQEFQKSGLDTSDGIQFSEVIKKFFLLGQIIAKALHDGRVLDLHFLKAFYKLVLGQELSLYDILSFDPGLGTTIEDLCLDFTFPGYPDIVLSSEPDHLMVNMRNLEDYVSRIVDATIRVPELPGMPSTS
ncbi:E3 ubiquitin-protein ligase [Quillaja saponaria]|uniref:E3 ubiquitin-protein ligase n=1 Tax=Quillaja saponaria TaxID=32244 RepID=A0AAD7Q0E3_QUISA|nr:E3 ubiquitin-protein ligase [Quillaja saponaria]